MDVPGFDYERHCVSDGERLVRMVSVVLTLTSEHKAVGDAIQQVVRSGNAGRTDPVLARVKGVLKPRAVRNREPASEP